MPEFSISVGVIRPADGKLLDLTGRPCDARHELLNILPVVLIVQIGDTPLIMTICAIR